MRLVDVQLGRLPHVLIKARSLAVVVDACRTFAASPALPGPLTFSEQANFCIRTLRVIAVRVKAFCTHRNPSSGFKSN